MIQALLDKVRRLILRLWGPEDIWDISDIEADRVDPKLRWTNGQGKR